MSTNPLHQVSPLPIVDLDHITRPDNGVNISAPSMCQRHFERDNACQDHYERLRDNDNLHDKYIQCPHGLCSRYTTITNTNSVFTGFLLSGPWGGKRGNDLRKSHPSLVITDSEFSRYETAFKNWHSRILNFERNLADNYAFALHEIRKLNRTVKQTAERICLSKNGSAPDQADPDLVSIWKTSELMTSQFNVIELLANSELVQLEAVNKCEIYRLFDKCVKIYRSVNPDRRIQLHSDPNFYPIISACDKTISIIPTVLIENSLKYSLPGSTIDIYVRDTYPFCEINVSNLTKLNNSLDESIFKRGVRASPDGEGSGNGLFLAKQVVEQHNGSMRLVISEKNSQHMKCTITVRFQIRFYKD